tara:strand:- start:260 stop:556 length:297 start_codon:yes stop_codon:yes gene_type:complete
VNSSLKISYLLALLLAVGSIANSSATDSCLENLSCADNNLNIGLLENEEDTNDLDSFSCESIRTAFNLDRTHSHFELQLQRVANHFSHRPIRAPPSSS